MKTSNCIELQGKKAEIETPRAEKNHLFKLKNKIERAIPASMVILTNPSYHTTGNDFLVIVRDEFLILFFLVSDL